MGESIQRHEFGALHAALAGASRVNLQSVASAVYIEAGTKVSESRSYYDVPAGGFGTEGTNYDSSRMGYDPMGRVWRTKSADGTISRTVFDVLGRLLRAGPARMTPPSAAANRQVRTT